MGLFVRFEKVRFIYGARSVALGVYRAICALYPQNHVEGFVVSSLYGNPKTLAGLPVLELKDISDKDALILIAAPENVQDEIAAYLKENGFWNYIRVDSKMENELMEGYYQKTKMFLSIHSLSAGDSPAGIRMFMVKSGVDKPLSRTYSLPEWIEPLQVGAALSDRQTAVLRDDAGENISRKNRLYCELTALYWIWKNQLKGVDYYGVCHYRRILDIDAEDLKRLSENHIDAVLPFPMLHEPDMCEHHTRYMGEDDWNAMLTALKQTQPEYYDAFQAIKNQPYFYNYNMMLATKEVWSDYCGWLFSVLERTEAGRPEGAKRYIAYLGESLMTIYFMYNRQNWKIAHTGRIMLT